jgi:hypothetical protein
MTSQALTTSTAIADWLRLRIRNGEGLTAPYARRWEVGGCTPTHSLWDWPSDRLTTLGSELLLLAHPVYGIEDAVIVDVPDTPVLVAVNRSSPGDGPLDAYIVSIQPNQPPQYVGNSPEVVAELIRNLSKPPPPPLVDDKRVQVGFPGYDREPKYVGSWSWNIHGEARGEEFVTRAAAATLAAIEARSTEE